jgi:hypothetical protein
LALALIANAALADDEPGFISLFDGATLDQWQIVNKSGRGYIVENGAIVCPRDGGGNLFSRKTYANFILRLEFKVEAGGNNGVGLRAPLEGDAAYVGMEIQVLDDYAKQYADKLRPEQYCGSIYDLFPAKRGALKPAGEWNQQEIVCDGRRVKITLNGQVIVDASLDDVKDPEKLQRHPGVKRSSGHIGFLGHGSRVEFRNVRIKEL